MVQLRCSYCGKKFSTPATKCPHCGTEINKEKKVTIVSLIKNAHRYDNPTIVIKNEWYQHLGVVNYKEKIELDIERESILRFSTQYLESRSALCTVKPGDVVYLSRNWTIDGLNPIVIHKDNKLPVFDTTNKNKVNFVKLIVLVLFLALVCGVIYYESKHPHHNQTTKETKANTMEWIYGDWESETPYGTIRVTICKDGRIYNSVDETWHSYSLDGSKLVEQCKGYISTYPIDQVGKRIGSGEPGYWFKKVRSSSSKSSNNDKSIREISNHPWKRIMDGDPYGSCLLEVLSFSEDGRGYCQEIRYAGGNKINASGFSFSYYIEGEKVYCEGTWEYNFRNGNLYDRQNHMYKSGSDLLY